MTFSARIAYTFLTAYILTFYSEWMFWTGRPPSESFYLEAIPTWIAYSFIIFFFITTVSYFRARSFWAIFLCGALYGWLLEGVLVQTMYDALPIQISFTGLSWHALISVMFGWWWLPRRLRESRAIIPCLLFGVALGLWSIGWWLEPDVAVAAPESVTFYNLFFGIPLVPAYIFWSRLSSQIVTPSHVRSSFSSPSLLAERGLGGEVALNESASKNSPEVRGKSFRPSRLELIIATLLLALYFAFVTVPTQPLALIVLPPLLALILWSLRRNRQREPEISPETTPITLKQALPLLLIPIMASLVYAGALTIGLTLPSLQILFVISMPLGFLLFAVSVYKTARSSVH